MCMQGCLGIQLVAFWHLNDWILRLPLHHTLHTCRDAPSLMCTPPCPSVLHPPSWGTSQDPSLKWHATSVPHKHVYCSMHRASVYHTAELPRRYGSSDWVWAWMHITASPGIARGLHDFMDSMSMQAVTVELRHSGAFKVAIVVGLHCHYSRLGSITRQGGYTLVLGSSPPRFPTCTCRLAAMRGWA